MSGRDDGAVVLVVERRRTEVDEANIGALDPHVLLLLDTATTTITTSITRPH